MPIAGVHLAAVARRSEIFPHNSFPIETLALKSGPPPGGMMPNQYTSGGLALLPKRFPQSGRKNESIPTTHLSLRVLTSWALDVINYVIIACFHAKPNR